MAHILHRIGRRTIFFTDHALDRYWQRQLDDDPHAGRAEARRKLEDQMADARWERYPPCWVHMTIWHHARCEGAVVLDDDHVFIVNKNASGDLVAVTYLTNDRKEIFDAVT